MYLYNYIYMCLYIGTFLYFQWVDKVMPAALWQVNKFVSWGFLAWGVYSAGKIIVNCIMLNSKGQMAAEYVRSGILLAVLNFLPVLLMSLFMLKEGFAGK